MAEVMLGKELHPDRVIPIEKLYEILNEYGINYSFLAQYGIENNAFDVVRCKDCVHWYDRDETCLKIYSDGAVSPYAWQFRNADDFCSYGERRSNG